MELIAYHNVKTMDSAEKRRRVNALAQAELMRIIEGRRNG